MSNNVFFTILKRATYSSTGNFGARILAAITGIIIARAVGPASFGVYVALWALIGLVNAATQFGITTGLKKEGAQHPERLPVLLGNALLIKAFIGICFLIVAGYSFSAVTTSTKAGLIFIPLAVAGLSVVCSEPFFAALQVKGHQKLISFLLMGRGCLFLVGVVVLVSFKFDIVTISCYQGFIYLIALVIACQMTTPIVSINIEFSSILPQVKGSFAFGISGFLYTIYSQAPLLILSHFSSAENVGYFAVALRFVTLSILIGTAAINEAFLPSLFGLYRNNLEQFHKVCLLMQKLFIPMGILISFALYMCAEIIIIMLQGEEYRPAIGILRILCWSVAFSYGSLTADAVLTATNKMMVKNTYQACVATVALIFGVILIKKMGVVGANYITLLSSFFILFLFNQYAFRKKLITLFRLLK